MRRPGSATAILTGCAFLLLPAIASAWVQATTNELPHLPLHVSESNCLQYTVQSSCSVDADNELCLAAVDVGMWTWNLRGSYLQFQPTETASCCRAEYRADGPNANCIVWLEDEWPAEYPAGGIGLTTITYDAATGTILDADMEMNGVDFRWGTECLPGVVDVQNTVAHEAGHMLGLDHSDVVEATMYPRADVGDCSLRDLVPDDVEGACAIYPYENDPGQCLGPREGLALECLPPVSSGGCWIAQPHGVPHLLPEIAFVCLCIAAGAFGRRRRGPFGTVVRRFAAPGHSARSVRPPTARGRIRVRRRVISRQASGRPRSAAGRPGGNVPIGVRADATGRATGIPETAVMRAGCAAKNGRASSGTTAAIRRASLPGRAPGGGEELQ